MLAQFFIRIRPGANVGSIRDLGRETLFPSCRIRQALKEIQKTICGNHHQLLGFRKCSNIEEPILNQHPLFADGAGVTKSGGAGETKGDSAGVTEGTPILTTNNMFVDPIY